MASSDSQSPPRQTDHGGGREAETGTDGKEKRVQREEAEEIETEEDPGVLTTGTGKRSRSPRRRSPETSGPLQRRGPLPSQADAFKGGDTGSPSPGPEKQKPNFRPSGLLAAASNTIATSSGNIVLKYHEPAEARKPPSSQRWRLYVFKGEEILDTLDLYTQSCWLFGREVSVCDYALEHPSCSKQHAVIQFRHIEKRNEFGDKIGKVRPYIIDLESGNGTTLNEEPVPEGRYMELRDKDVIKFGHSTREYMVQLPPG
ncbi:hypothetical protein H2204_010859 [Knufia peltigerae]|uniref:FHA domain-containing protein n=1 Tax=Knufia peltigerae TaxID=1002370 RepID=A0AA39CTQ7_9EURO|nr:hypothetical protein H2204_010859 [Knufia peltigerae]